LQHIATAFRIHAMGPVIFVEERFHSLWRRKFLVWSCAGNWNNYWCFTAAIAASCIRKRLQQCLTSLRSWSFATSNI